MIDAGADCARPVLGGEVVSVRVAGGRVIAEHRGSGPVMLLLHGWTLDRRMWAFQAATLAARFRMVAIDRRGCGQSSAPPDPAREVDDLIAVLDALAIERCALVGMSQGARVALDFAVHVPERVSALVLQGSPLPFAQAAREADVPARAMAELAARDEFAALHAQWRDHPLMAVQGDEAVAIRDAMVADYDGADLLAPTDPIVLTSQALTTIAAPTLLLTGADETPARKQAAATLAALLLHAEQREVPGGHLCNLSDAPAYNRTLLDFLTR